MELLRFPSRGGFSVRSVFIFALTVIITALLWATFVSTPTHAADAQWNGASLQYNGNQYLSYGTAQTGDSIGLPAGTDFYAYIPTAPSTSATGPATQKAYVIYFAPGASPPSEANATYVEYTYDPSTKIFSNPTNSTAITVDTNSAASTGTACAIEGIGWIACPAMTWLANGMDSVFDLIADFMEVQPLQTGNTQGSLYQSWNMVRSIANIAFIIVFIIIIYSQLTNIGVTSYGLKKLIPRLIIAAVAVNISYYIAAIAVDISNILGYSLQDLLMGMQREVVANGVVDPNAQADINSGLSWGAFTAFIISGGTAVVAGTTGLLIASGGTITAIAFLLLPTLLGLILALLVVFLILAARQAIIIILVIIAPLAIVAYLLPNTEKWFDKWRGLFMTMLIFFPAFAVVFGGAQLAGSIIIKNADSVTMQLLGMTVQIAPLVITPILLKFSGSLLGNIARIVNNPNKGLIDRTRNWSNARADWHKKRGTGGLDRKGNPINAVDKNGNPVVGGLTGKNFARRSARYLDGRTRRLADRTANAETATANAYENGKLYAKTDRKGNVRYDMALQKAAIKSDQEATHNRHGAHVEHAKTHRGSMMYDRAITEESTKELFTAAQNDTAAHFNRERIIGGTALNRSSRQIELSKMRLDISDNDKQIYFTEERMRTGTQLNALVDTFESSKLHLEGSQQRYTARVDTMKTDPSNALYLASQVAQAGKDHAEAAQNRVQAMFDDLRKTERAPGDPTPNVLNVAARDLVSSKVIAERGQAEFTEYISTLKSTQGTTLHRQVVDAEKAKQSAQVAETKLTRIVEEYKGGGKRDENGNIFIDGQQVTDQSILSLTEQMVYNTEQLSAEKQGVESAQYEQRQHVSRLLAAEEGSADWARAQELLNVAGSIDNNGQQRALANALAQRSRSRTEVLNNIKSIFSFRNITDADVSRLAQGEDIPGIEKTQDTIAAALEAILSGGNAEEIVNVMQKTDFSFPGMSDEEREELQIIASDALMGNSARPPFMTVGFTKMLKSGKRFDGTLFTDAAADPANPDGKLNSAATGDPNPGNTPFNRMIITAINNGKIDSKKLQGAGKDYAKAVFEAMDSLPGDINATAKTKLLAELAKTLDPKREASEGLADSLPFLQSMVDNLGGELMPDGSVKLNPDGTPKQ